MAAEPRKAHAVCVPYPAQGHINPMLQLSKLLHSHGFHVTFVNTVYNHRRLLKSRGAAFFESLPSDFRFESIPDGLDDEDDVEDATQDIPSLCDSTSKNCVGPFRELVAKLSETGPAVSCIVSDGSMAFTLEVAKEVGVPEALFWTPSGCGVLAYVNYHVLAERGMFPLKDSSYMNNGYLDTTVDFIPGLKKNIRLKDLPSFIRTTDPNDIMFNFIKREIPKGRQASAVLVNTFDLLEQEVVEALSSFFPNLLTIGPLNLLLHQVSQNNLKDISTNLWAEQSECVHWLDKKEPNSILYVNFGSITVMTPDQMTEFAWGLAMSKKPFLWVIRPDLVSKNSTGNNLSLPDEFVEETKDRGMLVGWCNQEQILKHPSIGGFLSHMGWNSTIESLTYGVPMICWPFFAEQQTNCFYACEEWGVGMEIDPEVKREEVEKLVKEVMGGEKGKDMKRKAMEWKMKAEEAIKPGGSSYRNVERLIEVKQNQSKSMSAEAKPHVVCVPYPAQGHINPMLQVAKLFHSRGFHVTFVNTEYNHRRLLRTRGVAFFQSLPPNFNFDAIPDGLKYSTLEDGDNIDVTQDIPSLCDTTSKNCLVPFRDLVKRLNDDVVSPMVSCIVSDNAMTFTLDVAKELGIPNARLTVPGACGFLAYHSFPALVERGLVPLKDSSCLTNGYLETAVDFISGMNKNIRLKDFPTFMRITDPNDMMFKYVLETAPRIYEGSAVLLNTFDPLEHECLAALSTVFPNVLTIGPLNLLKKGDKLKDINTSLWIEQPHCLNWLDSKDPNSVLYVNFGSITILTPEQLNEFAWGLAKSEKPFLWVIRPDLVAGESAILPVEFVEDTKDRGMLVGWCAQEQILQHPSVGGFLSHMGWNSTIESLSYGVPMICWPFFADQQTNCFYACEEWGVGMEIDPEVKREEVEKLVKEVMGGEKGKEMKMKAMEWKMKAEEATKLGGSSHQNVDRLIEVLLQNN
ncbi:7-deoxyloganetin glucosyltransferase [Linum perenne]